VVTVVASIPSVPVPLLLFGLPAFDEKLEFGLDEVPTVETAEEDAHRLAPDLLPLELLDLDEDEVLLLGEFLDTLEVDQEVVLAGLV